MAINEIVCPLNAAKVKIVELKSGQYRCRLYIKDIQYPKGNVYWKAFPKLDAIALTLNDAAYCGRMMIKEVTE